MKVYKFPIGLLKTNCYLLINDHDAVIIDPGSADMSDYDPIFDFIKSNDVSLHAVLLTHGHFDHILGVDQICKSSSLSVYAHNECHSVMHDPYRNLSIRFLGKGFIPLSHTVTFSDADTITFGSLELKTVHTPGHSSGSCCFICGDILFSGDTLFKSSVGRTDHADGDYFVLQKSIKKLMSICGETRYTVYPGHGDITELPNEFYTNPFIYRG